VSHLERSELKANAIVNAARSVPQHSKENDNIPHKKHKKVQKEKLRSVSRIHVHVFLFGKENNTRKSKLTVIHTDDLARVPLGYICIEGRCLLKRCKRSAPQHTPHKKHKKFNNKKEV